MSPVTCPYLVARNQCGLELQAPQLLTTAKRRVEMADIDHDWMRPDLPSDERRYVAWDPHAVRAAFSGLDPAADYEIEVTYLAERDVIRVQSLTSGATELHPPTRLTPGRPMVIRAPVPPDALVDGTLPVSVNRITGPDALVAEICLFASVAPAPAITVVGDSDGGLVGAVSRADYTGVAGAAVTVEWPGGRAEATTDHIGLFTVPAAQFVPLGRHAELTVTAQPPGDGPAAVATVHTRHLARGLRALPPEPDRLDLAGAWAFTPGTGTQPAGTARVPGHVAFDGLVPERGVATLSRTVDVPPSWFDGALFLRFDAVYGRACVFVNDALAGVHGGGATSFDVDVTGFLHPGENTLAVTITEYTPHAVLDNMSWYAHMSLLGIWRPVCLYRTPTTHLGVVDVVADWDPDTGCGSLRLSVDVLNVLSTDTTWDLRVGLSDADGEICAVSSSGEVGGRVELAMDDLAVEPWSAEVPLLYRLDLRLDSGMCYERRVGFRRVEVRGNRLLINGASVRMLGMNKHDSRMLTGRALTTDQLRQDVVNLRRANVNTIRTCHYPPDPRLLDICDEVGMYVFDQPPICFSGGFDDHHWNRTNDSANLVPILLEVTAETVQRDKSHASVLAWDLGNESRWSEGFDAQLAMVRRLDPTRPTLFSYDANGLPENVLPSRPPERRPDLRSYHYPGWDRTWPEELVWLNSFEQPMVLDEFAPLFQECVRVDLDGYSMGIDPGLRDYWVVGYQSFMAEALGEKGCIGGMIWSGVDDVFAIPLDLRIGEGAWAHLPKTDFGLVRQLFPGYPGTFFRGDAEWGVIDSWGRTRPELWHVHKMYSPLSATASRHDDRLTVTVNNRHAHRELGDLAVRLYGASGPDRLRAEPGESAQFELRIDPGAERVTVEFWHPEGWLVDAYTWATGAGVPVQARVEDRAEPLGLSTTGTGALTVTGSRPWLTGWPKLHLLDANRPGDPVTTPAADLTRVSVMDGVATVRLSGGDWTGSLTARIDGVRLILSYQCVYGGREPFQAREIGLTLRPPDALTDLWWQRIGEWSYYPSDHIGRTEGYAPGMPGQEDVLHPAATWEQDTTARGSNDYRSVKRTVLAAGTTDGSVSLSVISDGTQHVRTELVDGAPVLHVLNWYGGVRTVDGVHPIWSRYFGAGQRIENGTEITGAIVVVCGDLPAELREPGPRR